MSVVEIGRRLAELRKALSRDTGQEWTQPRIARQLGVSSNMIHRLEYGGGSLENLGKLLDFYHQQGFNIQWVMVSDNTSIGMYRPDSASEQELRQTLEKLNKILNNK